MIDNSEFIESYIKNYTPPPKAPTRNDVVEPYLIYCIKSTKTKKCYIGSTNTSLKERYDHHIEGYLSYTAGLDEPKAQYVSSHEVLKYGDCDIIALDNTVCNRLGARQLEQQWLDRTPYTVNKNRACQLKFMPR